MVTYFCSQVKGDLVQKRKVYTVLVRNAEGHKNLEDIV